MPALSNTVNLGFHVSYGTIVVCGPPSFAAETCKPCQWIVVVSLSWLLTSISTKSPLLNIRVGPRIFALTPIVAVLWLSKKLKLPFWSVSSNEFPDNVSGISNGFCASRDATCTFNRSKKNTFIFIWNNNISYVLTILAILLFGRTFLRSKWIKPPP